MHQVVRHAAVERMVTLLGPWDVTSDDILNYKAPDTQPFSDYQQGTEDMQTANPINLKGIDHVVLRARDFDGLISFYTDVMGCRLERISPNYGIAQLRAGHSLVDIVDVDGRLGQVGGHPPDHAAENMDHFCLQISPWNAEAIIDHLRSHDVEVGNVERRYGAQGNGPSLYIKDPEGNGLELKGIEAT